MASMSDYLERKIANLTLAATAYTAPTIYCALFTTATTDAGGGTEVTGGSYARVALAGKFTALTTETDGVMSNTSSITFAAATASWGTVTHVAIIDASTGGNFLYHGALTASKAVGSGDTFSFAVGDLTVTFA